jgi:anti-sigma factor RsiW
MKCDEIRELLSPYIDKMLDEREMREVEEHLSACGGCRNEYNELKEMVDLLGQAAIVPVPDEFGFRLKKGLSEVKQDMIKAGIFEKRSRKNRWRIITSVAAYLQSVWYPLACITISSEFCRIS